MNGDTKNTVHVFDLDGVITSPDNSKVNNLLLQKIHDLLQSGTFVAVNTGRSYEWVQNNLINYLAGKENADLFNNLVVVCEKGGEKIEWVNENAEITPSRFALSSQEYEEVKKLYENEKINLSTMFWDSTKRTMATIEKKPSASLDDFHEQQRYLTDLLLNKFSGDNVKVDPTTIATDVESPQAGKYSGAEIIYEWISSRSSSVKSYVSFGDSLSDYEMARCFADHGCQSTFVYVGKNHEQLADDTRIQRIVTVQKFDKGALEYFDSY